MFNDANISKKKQIHPGPADGSSRLSIKNPASVPTGTENIITQNVAESNKERIVELIYLILKAGSVINNVNSEDTVSVVRTTIKKWITDR